MRTALNKMSRPIINMFGAIGYSLLLLSYVIMVGVGLFWLIHGGHLTGIGVLPPQDQNIVEATLDEPSETSLIAMTVAYIVTAFMALTVLFVVITLPYWLGKIGSYLIRRAIRFFQWSVTPASLLLAKAVACGVVTVATLVYVVQDLGNIVILWLVMVISVVTLAVFLIQHYLARVDGLEAKEIW